MLSLLAQQHARTTVFPYLTTISPATQPNPTSKLNNITTTTQQHMHMISLKHRRLFRLGKLAWLDRGKSRLLLWLAGETTTMAGERICKRVVRRWQAKAEKGMASPPAKQQRQDESPSHQRPARAAYLSISTAIQNVKT
jgi:hypothetical protein